MPSIRKTKTASGATAIQVVCYKKRRVDILKHIGSARSPEDVGALIASAEAWIRLRSSQPSLFPPSPNRVLHLSAARFLGVRYAFAYTFLKNAIHHCGFSALADPLLLDLILIRLFEPCSKRQSLILLERYFGVRHTERTLYRTLQTMTKHKADAERLAVAFAKKEFDCDLSFVLYDVTTLYFESFEPDDLRKKGNTFEGHTMIPVVKAFQTTYGATTLTVVADAAMLSVANMEKLHSDGLLYIRPVAQ